MLALCFLPTCPVGRDGGPDRPLTLTLFFFLLALSLRPGGREKLFFAARYPPAPVSDILEKIKIFWRSERCQDMR